MSSFHLALPVYNLEEAKLFYVTLLGQRECRSAINWLDVDFFGHQLSLHLVNEKNANPESTLIDGDQVPARHFGMILDKNQWELLRDKLISHKISFVIKPKLRFAGKEGEQGTFFINDPSGNYLEFKYFTDTSQGEWY